jgi:hypothetical protein
MHRIFNIYILKTYLETDAYGGGGVGSFHSGSRQEATLKPHLIYQSTVQPPHRS